MKPSVLMRDPSYRGSRLKIIPFRGLVLPAEDGTARVEVKLPECTGIMRRLQWSLPTGEARLYHWEWGGVEQLVTPQNYHDGLVSPIEIEAFPMNGRGHMWFCWMVQGVAQGGIVPSLSGWMGLEVLCSK